MEIMQEILRMMKRIFCQMNCGKRFKWQLWQAGEGGAHTIDIYTHVYISSLSLSLLVKGAQQQILVWLLHCQRFLGNHTEQGSSTPFSTSSFFLFCFPYCLPFCLFALSCLSFSAAITIMVTTMSTNQERLKRLHLRLLLPFWPLPPLGTWHTRIA